MLTLLWKFTVFMNGFAINVGIIVLNEIGTERRIDVLMEWLLEDVNVV